LVNAARSNRPRFMHRVGGFSSRGAEKPATNHSTIVDADPLSDDTLIRPFGARMVCTACGHIGADVRPDWPSRRQAA
jgi:hypothetical protein